MIGIGTIIRLNREELGYSQEKLAYGICATSSLSKIENDEQVPSRNTFEALMQRMGLSPGVYPSFLTDADKTSYELKHNFNELYGESKYNDASKILDKLEALPGLEKEHLKFISMARTLVGLQTGSIDPATAADKLEKDIGSFIKNFSIPKIERSVLTKTEINVLNSYAIAKHRSGDVTSAIEIYYGLISYIEKKIYDRRGFTVLYTKILYNLSKYVGMEKDDEEAVRLCDIGINSCIRYSVMEYLHLLLYNKGYGLINLGRTDEAHDCIRQSYYIQKALGKSYAKGLEITVTFAEKHGIKLI